MVNSIKVFKKKKGYVNPQSVDRIVVSILIKSATLLPDSIVMKLMLP